MKITNAQNKSNLKALCIIPARGGSKRLPRKNIKQLKGKPLVAYTIEAAQNSETLTHYLVSTEDKEILEIARQYNAPTPFVRPAELATDMVRNIDVVFHALQFMEKKNDLIYDIIILLQPTCPIRDPKHIDLAITELANSNLDTVVSVKGPFKKRDPVLKAIRKGELVDYCHVDDPTNSEPFYIYNASIYGVKRNYFVENKKLISPRQIPLIMDDFHSIDIDTEADFLVAESYMEYMNNNRKDK